jgi:hypothetical protein
MIAYLDTGVFDHIYNKTGCTGADIAALRKAIYGREISIRMSIHTLEEMLLERKATPQAFAARIKLTLSLANSRTLIKPCDQLLADDIRAYAARGEADRPFVRGEMQNAVSSGIAALIETDGEEIDDDFLEALEESKQQAQRFIGTMNIAREGAKPVVKSLPGDPGFEQYFQQGALPAAHALAERTGAIEECSNRGLEGLVTIKSVRMSVGAALSLLYAETFEKPPAQPDGSRNLQHAVSAAAVADAFVTDDARLRTVLSRVPMEGFEVTDLQGFLARVR